MHGAPLGFFLGRLLMSGTLDPVEPGMLEIVIERSPEVEALVGHYQRQIPVLRMTSGQPAASPLPAMIVDECRGRYVWVLDTTVSLESSSLRRVFGVLAQNPAPLYVVDPPLPATTLNGEDVLRAPFADIVAYCGFIGLSGKPSSLIVRRDLARTCDWPAFENISSGHALVGAMMEASHGQETLLFSRALVRLPPDGGQADAASDGTGNEPGLGLLRVLSHLEERGVIDEDYVFRLSEIVGPFQRYSTFVACMQSVGAGIRSWLVDGDEARKPTDDDLRLLDRLCRRGGVAWYERFEAYRDAVLLGDGIAPGNGRTGYAAVWTGLTRKTITALSNQIGDFALKSVDAVLEEIAGLRDIRPFQEVEKFKGYRIVRWADRHVAVHRSVGPVNLVHFGLAEVGGHIIHDRDLLDLKARIRGLVEGWDKALHGPPTDKRTPLSYRTLQSGTKHVAVSTTMRGMLTHDGVGEIGNWMFVGHSDEEVATCVLRYLLIGTRHIEDLAATRSLPDRNGEAWLDSVRYLFHEGWYRAQAAAYAKYGVKPPGEHENAFDHYRKTGAGAGLLFTPFFREDWYLSRHPEVQAGVRDGRWSSGLEHFAVEGQYRAYSPHPLIDVHWLVAARRRTDPSIDRVLSGAGAGKGGEGRSLLSFYLMSDAMAGLVANRFFDAHWYGKQYAGLLVEAGSTPRDLFLHFLSQGAAQGCQPNGRFSETDYLTRYPDAREAIARGEVASGFEHWMLIGRELGYN